MHMGPQERLERISSRSTEFWKDYFPKIWTLGIGTGMLGIWFEWFGEPASIGLKVLGFALWGATSLLFTVGAGSLREVWIADDRLIISSEGRKVSVPLSEVSEIRETRGQKLKTIRLLLRGSSQQGTEIRFIPVHRPQVPFSDHSVVRLLRERKTEIACEERGRDRLK